MAPIWLSVAIVFLFAGPHNYVEARYFLTRLPARMGRLRPFFIVSAVGVILLTVTYPLLLRIPALLNLAPVSLAWVIGIWNTGFVLWCTTLITMRGNQAPGRNWDYAWPCGVALTGVCWLQPMLLPFALVYAHPLMAIWVMDREIAQRRPGWQRNYRTCLLGIPILVVILWLALPVETTFDSSVTEPVQRQIANHVGAYLFSTCVGVRLIATHAFLEFLHYGIWLFAMPWVSGRVFSSAFREIPLMKRSACTRKAIRAGLVVAAVVVAVLWFFFSVDYSTTRDVYFTVATLHVLAEVPILLRLL